MHGPVFVDLRHLLGVQALSPQNVLKGSKNKYYLNSIDYNYRISQSIKKKKSFYRFATLNKRLKQTGKQSFILSFYKV